MSRPVIEYQIPRIYTVEKPCIYKLSFEGKYVIVKAKDIRQSVATIQKSLNQFLRGSEFQQRKDGVYYYFFEHVKKTEIGTFEAECLLESDNAYELLKREQIEIEQHKADPNFLNNASEAYIPLYNDETNSYGWITKNAVLNFRKWLKNRKPQYTP